MKYSVFRFVTWTVKQVCNSPSTEIATHMISCLISETCYVLIRSLKWVSSICIRCSYTHMLTPVDK